MPDVVEEAESKTPGLPRLLRSRPDSADCQATRTNFGAGLDAPGAGMNESSNTNCSLKLNGGKGYRYVLTT